jgi:hypothetical protein
MDPRVIGVMSNQHGLVTYAQARQVGLSDREVAALVRRGSWVRLRRGVFCTGEQWASAGPFRERPLLRVRAAHLVVQPDHWFSHESAALVHGVPLQDARAARVHLTRPQVLGDRAKAGIVHHKAVFSPHQAVVVDGLPVLDLARTACDLARSSGTTAGLAACDHALRHGISRGELRAVREQMRCWRGVSRVETSIDLADPGAENFAESAMRELVHELGIGWPSTQFGLRAEGRTVYADVRVGRHVFEFDGRVKLVSVAGGGVAEQEAVDVLRAEKARQDFITGFKLGVSRVTYRDLGVGRPEARLRLRREYADTVARFGTDIADLAPYVVQRRLPRL